LNVLFFGTTIKLDSRLRRLPRRNLPLIQPLLSRSQYSRWGAMHAHSAEQGLRFQVSSFVHHVRHKHKDDDITHLSCSCANRQSNDAVLVLCHSVWRRLMSHASTPRTAFT